MEENEELPENEQFSDDPEENLRMQNDFLKMKMMAESGAFFGGSADLPSDIENQFLKNVMEFEKAYANAKPQKLSDILSQPVFEDEVNFDDAKFSNEFKKLQKLLTEHNIHVDFIAERTDRFKYNFITKELFDHETDFVPVKGMTVNFIYEEFHPDYKQEITDVTNEFLDDFFERTLSVDTYYISNELILPDGNILSKEQLINRFESMYEVATEFENTSFQIETIDFEFKEPGNNSSGMGFSEGEINYDMIFRNGERKEIKGPFKIYFGRDLDSWNIYFFYLAGYNLHSKDKEK